MKIVFYILVFPYLIAHTYTHIHKLYICKGFVLFWTLCAPSWLYRKLVTLVTACTQNQFYHRVFPCIYLLTWILLFLSIILFYYGHDSQSIMISNHNRFYVHSATYSERNHSSTVWQNIPLLIASCPSLFFCSAFYILFVCLSVTSSPPFFFLNWWCVLNDVMT